METKKKNCRKDSESPLRFEEWRVDSDGVSIFYRKYCRLESNALGKSNALGESVLYNHSILGEQKKSGFGEPRAIILVHGNSESGEIFRGAAENLSRDFTVYCPDSRGHGKSDGVRRLHYADMAEDIAALIGHEKLERPLLFGFSDGGIVGLLLAARYPQLLGGLFVAGINLSPMGLKSSVRRLMRLGYFFTRKDKLRLMLSEPNITAEELEKIAAPTTVFYAEKDIVALKDSMLAVETIPDCRLVLVHGETHESYIMDNDKLYNLLAEHLFFGARGE